MGTHERIRGTLCGFSIVSSSDLMFFAGGCWIGPLCCSLCLLGMSVGLRAFSVSFENKNDNDKPSICYLST